jgi:hypothetical protein
MSARGPLLLASYGFVIACSPTVGSLRPLDGGRYQLECKTSLRECLARAEARCDISGYQVVDATEAKRRVGVPPVQSEYTESRAIFVCGGTDGRLEQTPAPAVPTTPPPTSADARCFPGASQACVGPAGCSGGQTCLPGGNALSPCDCGPQTPAQQGSTTPP